MSKPLTPRQKRAARNLALGYSQSVAARRSGCNARTIRRWLVEHPDFAKYVEDQRASVSTEDDVEGVLRDLLYSDNENIRIQAARELRRMPHPSGAKREDDDEDDLLTGWDDA